ncbi:VOC family protein [Novosphingobium aquimarinum]|uniref:VOC family protein n=1 Tax=Novosphingobium aquimarinum TaxID=2682494 RepID=UPI0012EB5120|nr:VOC family protein [Novosphingobium aquimarinum]
MRLALTTLVVPDYDQAIAFYVGILGFELREDTRLTDEKRWVVVAPRQSEGALLLARAANEAQRAAIGHQTGGRVAFFLETDDFARDHATWRDRGVRFVREPVREAYGTVAVFTDPWGNLWDLIEPA